MKKRMLCAAALLLSLTVLLGGCTPWWKFLPASTDAESSTPTATTAAVAEPCVTIAVGQGQASGDTVIVPVLITPKSGLVNADILLKYDPAKLRLQKLYNTAQEEEVLASAGIWDGTLRAEQTAEGELCVLLATGGAGLAAEGALFTVAFECVGGEALPADITLEVPVCGIAGENGDVDAVKAGLVAVQSGAIAAPSATQTATATATQVAE